MTQEGEVTCPGAAAACELGTPASKPTSGTCATSGALRAGKTAFHPPGQQLHVADRVTRNGGTFWSPHQPLPPALVEGNILLGSQAPQHRLSLLKGATLTLCSSSRENKGLLLSVPGPGPVTGLPRSRTGSRTRKAGTCHLGWGTG